jgi:fructosamine-3-kinase
VEPFADTVADALDVEVVSLARLGGGDVARSYRVLLADGRTVFAKCHDDPPPGFFVTEAAGLSWLRDCPDVHVPEVLAVSDGSDALLVLEWIDESPRAVSTAAGEAAFGQALAGLHRTGAPSFGRQDRRPTGSRSLPNDPCATWAEFFATRRLEPLCRMARDSGALDADVVADIERIAASLDQVAAADEPPARLHGDLWAGNRLVDRDGSSWLIDPAAHGGHREFDIAMMHLFGGFSPEVVDAYHDAFPLADGWRDRIPLHQLAPLTVHAVKFGGGYRDATRRAVAQAVRLI